MSPAAKGLVASSTTKSMIEPHLGSAAFLAFAPTPFGGNGSFDNHALPAEGQLNYYPTVVKLQTLISAVDQTCTKK